MDYRQPVTLGRTGLSVGRLGVGSAYGVPAAALERAFHEYGVNYFYWGSIRRGGMKQAIRHLAPTERDRMVVALQSYDRTGALMPLFVERGLRALRVTHADVLILGMHQRQPADRVLQAAARLKEQGKVRFLALSGHKRSLLGQLAASESSPFDILMLRYNAAHRGAEEDIFAQLPDRDRPGITAFTATRWGHLLKQRRMPSGEPAMSATECYRFVLSHPDVDLCICGPSNAAQLDQAVQALDAGPLADEELARCRRLGDHVHG